MSYTEIRSREGLPYGGMPYDAIAAKLEETDPELVEEVRGFDEFHTVEDDYDTYVREEITDWGPDAPFLESDHARRDPGLSRSILNLHYNGTRGSHPELPRHPELFYGFTGNDPRGSVNDPRFDEVRGHITSRAANLTVAMGDNDDNHVAERPWTAQSISYGMKELQRRLKGNTKIFSVSKEGRPWSRNYVADQFAPGDLRAAQLRAGDDGFQDNIPGFDGFHGPAPARFAAGDHGPATELFSDGARGAGVPDDRAAPWRHVTGDGDLGVQQYGQQRSGGRADLAPGAVGGGRARVGGADQDWGATLRSRGTNRKVLGASMAQAARHRAALKSGRPDQDWSQAAGYVNQATPGSGLAPSRDVGRLYRDTVEDQSRRPGTEVQDGDGGRLGAASGLTPAAHPEHAVRSGVAAVTPNDYLTNAESIVKGLREGSAAGRRRIADRVVADGARHLAVGEAEPAARRGLAPARDPARVSKLAEMPLQRAAAAEGLTVHTYRGAPPVRSDERVRNAQFDPATWRPSHEALPLGASKAPGEFRSHGKDPTTIGDHPDRVFGFTAEVLGAANGAPNGPKGLRSGGWSDEAGLSDGLGSGING